jgi:hypothetical protein
MRADPNKVHLPTAADAARWYALAEVAHQIATGASKAWHELARLGKVCETTTVFGVVDALNPCCRLAVAAADCAKSAHPHLWDDRLKETAEAVKAAFYDWEAGQ